MRKFSHYLLFFREVPLLFYSLQYQNRNLRSYSMQNGTYFLVLNKVIEIKNLCNHSLTHQTLDLGLQPTLTILHHAGQSQDK